MNLLNEKYMTPCQVAVDVLKEKYKLSNVFGCWGLVSIFKKPTVAAGRPGNVAQAKLEAQSASPAQGDVL